MIPYNGFRFFSLLGLLFFIAGCDAIADQVYPREKVYGDMPLTENLVSETVVLLKDRSADFNPSVSGLLFERLRYKNEGKTKDVNRVMLGVGKDMPSFFTSNQIQKGKRYRINGKYFGTSWYGCTNQPNLIPDFPPCMDTTGLMVFNIASFYITSIEPLP
ncbi:MAG TPA: hypothetical protein PLO56_15725 [Rhodothermales bacterium]|nr:hypothetical protein [Rhodothermales bacterium]